MTTITYEALDTQGRLVTVTLPTPPPMTPEEQRVADLLDRLPRPRGVHEHAHVLRYSADTDLVDWSDGHVTHVPG